MGDLVRHSLTVRLAALIVLAAVATGCQSPRVMPNAATAELILHNAKIITVDEANSRVEAVAVRGGRFVAVGRNADILATAGPATRIVDMRGATVVPGFHDTHSHFLQMGLNLPATIDLTEVRSIEDIRNVIAKRVAAVRPGAWIFSEGGWWEFMLSDGRLPNRHDLDVVSPANPVVLRGGHYFIANSLALKLAGVTRDTPSPEGGEIWRDSDGEPTGFLLRAARDPMLKFFAKLSRDLQLDGVRQSIRRMNSWGVTSVREAGGTADQVQMLKELYGNGELTLRVDWSYDVDPNTPADQLDDVLASLGSPGQTWGDGFFRSDSIAEMFLDGAEESAQLRAPYVGRPNYHGLRLVQQDKLNRFVLALAQRGWRPSPHAVGDAAIDQILDAYESVDRVQSIRDRRWMIDHAILLHPDQYDRVRRLGLLINAQPRLLHIIGDKFVEYWGLPRAERAFSLRDWRDHGIRFTLGADRPASFRASPLMLIYFAATRRIGPGSVLGPDQSISVQEALTAITRDAALTSFDEGNKGSIEVGKYADMAVLSDDLLSVPPESVKDIKVVATIVSGKLVYGAID